MGQQELLPFFCGIFRESSTANKDGKGNDKEVDNILCKNKPYCKEIGSPVVEGMVTASSEILIEPVKYGNSRHDDVIDQRGYDFSECCTDYNTHCHVNHIAFGNKGLKSVKNLFIGSTPF